MSGESLEAKQSHEGDQVTLSCRYDANIKSAGKVLAFYWLKSETQGLTDVVAINSNSLSPGYEPESSDGRYDLTIVSVEFPRDNGYFVCKIKEVGTGLTVQSKGYVLTRSGKRVFSLLSC